MAVGTWRPGGACGVTQQQQVASIEGRNKTTILIGEW
jgi:hypothetical protein